MKKITPFLWFDHQAEEAAQFYVSVFRRGKVTSASGQSVSFQLEGQDFIALNGGPHFKFTPAISLFVNCETQKEVDYFWKKLSKGGAEGRCGWLTDRFGLSWQVVPSVLGALLRDPDRAKSGRVMQAMLKMNKLQIAKLKQAARAPR